MGHIKEPDGIDLVINSRELTKEEEIAISNYISEYKAINSRKRHLKSRKIIKKKRLLAN